MTNFLFRNPTTISKNMSKVEIIFLLPKLTHLPKCLCLGCQGHVSCPRSRSRSPCTVLPLVPLPSSLPSSQCPVSHYGQQNKELSAGKNVYSQGPEA